MMATLNENAAGGNRTAVSTDDTLKFHDNEKIDLSKAFIDETKNIEYLIVANTPTAKNQLQALIKTEKNNISCTWRGGKKINGKWTQPDTPYHSIPKEKKDDFWRIVDNFGIPIDEIELRPIIAPLPPPKHVKTANQIAELGDQYNESLKMIEAKELQELSDARSLFDREVISATDYANREQEIKGRYAKEKKYLSERANRNYQAADIINEVGEKKGESADSFIVEPGKTHLAAAEGRKILSDPVHGVFRRSGLTVWLSDYRESESKNKVIKKPDGAIQISEVDEPFLIEKLSEVRTWSKFDARTKHNKSIDFPSMAARMILSRKGEGLKYLKGFINAPTIRLDGSLLTKIGYDEETGLFFDPLGTQFQQVPEAPTKDDAIRALSVLVDLISEFPFEDEVSKAVAISELMTSVIRRSLPLAPIFANDAPAASSGKSLLAKLGCYMSTGKAPTMVSPSRNEEEMRKRLAACMMDGDLVLCIDNVDFPLESRDLCIVSTSEIWRERILGVSKNAQIETNAQIIITGNNLSIVGDLCTRTLKCRLVPMVEHPEERRFNVDLNSYIPKNRGSLVTAALTIIRAYVVAGEPTQSSKGFREYTDWCRLVRDPLLWIGCADPCESVRRVQDMDPKRSEMETLFGSLKTFPADSFTSKQLIDSASNREKRDNNEAYQQLYDVLTDLARNKDGSMCSTKLGNILKDYKDRICNGMRLKEVGKDRTNKTIWKLVYA